MTYGGNYAGGAFSQTGFAANNGFVTGTDFGGIVNNFNAHNSNSIYADNGKVYPASIALNFIIKT